MDYYRCNSNRCCSYSATGDNYAVMQGPQGPQGVPGPQGPQGPR